MTATNIPIPRTGTGGAQIYGTPGTGAWEQLLDTMAPAVVNNPPIRHRILPTLTAKIKRSIIVTALVWLILTLTHTYSTWLLVLAFVVSLTVANHDLRLAVRSHLNYKAKRRDWEEYNAWVTGLRHETVSHLRANPKEVFDLPTDDQRTWAIGALGEEKVGAVLETLPAEFSVAHDLEVVRDGQVVANIDHVVAGPTGVWVVDSKRWAGTLGVNSRTKTFCMVGDSATAEGTAIRAKSTETLRLHAEDLGVHVSGILVAVVGGGQVDNDRAVIKGEPPIIAVPSGPALTAEITGGYRYSEPNWTIPKLLTRNSSVRLPHV